MSLTRPSKVLPLTMMESRASLRSSSVSQPSLSSSEKPRMAFSGVRMSWLTVAKNRLLALAASRSVSRSRRRMTKKSASMRASTDTVMAVCT